MDRTLVIVKPDGVERGLIGAIISRLESRGLHIVAGDLRTIDKDTAARHYAEHDGREYYANLIAFITRGPSLPMIVEGPSDTWKVVRAMMGATNPLDAAPGTIRGDYALVMAENLIHGSDSPESAAREIAIFFPNVS